MTRPTLKELFNHFKKNRKGQFGSLSAAALALITFGVIVVVGSVIVSNLGNNIGGAPNTTAQYLVTQFGSTSGGLASWTGVIVAVLVGSLLIALISGAFRGNRG